MILTYSNGPGRVKRVREKMRYLLWGNPSSMKILHLTFLWDLVHIGKKELSLEGMRKGSLTGKERTFEAKRTHEKRLKG